MHNLKHMLLLVLISFVPILIISRFRIIFNYRNRTVTHIGYFSRKKQYHFDEIHVTTNRRKHSPIMCYIFTQKQHKLFQISEVDFEAQTLQNPSRLKELFTGNEKFLYDLECNIDAKGFSLIVTNYALTNFIGYMHGSVPKSWINLGFDSANNIFFLQAFKAEKTEDSEYKEKLIEEVRTNLDSLEDCALEMAYKHLQPL